MVEQKYGNQGQKTKLWLRLPNTYIWNLLDDMNLIIEKINKFDRANLMLEVYTNSILLI